jgi:MFS family permease
MSIVASTLRTVRGNFSPLSQPNFRTYIGGQAVSLIGTWLQVTAQSWVVWQITGSEAALGVVSMLNALPMLVLGAYAGVWVDRVDRRKLLIATQIVSMFLAFILAFLSQTGLVQLWHVYLLSFLLGVANALDNPAQQAFLGDLSGMSDVRKAINLNVMIFQVSRILGPALAGVVVARIGIAPAFWLNGLSFLAVIASLIIVRSGQQLNARFATAKPMQQIREGLVYVRTNSRLQDLFIVAAVMTMFVFSIIVNILPAVADKMLGGNAETLGLLLASSGAGALISVLFVVPITQSFKRSGLVMLIGMIWLAFWFSVFAHCHSLPLAMLALGMGSMGAPAVMTMAMGLVQVMAPKDMRGRLISLFTIVSFGLQPVAALWIGQIAQNLGVETAIQLNAILLIISVIAILLFRPVMARSEYVQHVEEPLLIPDLPEDVEALRDEEPFVTLTESVI